MQLDFLGLLVDVEHLDGCIFLLLRNLPQIPHTDNHVVEILDNYGFSISIEAVKLQYFNSERVIAWCFPVLCPPHCLSRLPKRWC